MKKMILLVVATQSIAAMEEPPCWTNLCEEMKNEILCRMSPDTRGKLLIAAQNEKELVLDSLNRLPYTSIDWALCQTKKIAPSENPDRSLIAPGCRYRVDLFDKYGAFLFHIFDTKAEQYKHAFECPDATNDVKFGQDCNIIAIRLHDGSIKIWSREQNHFTHTINNNTDRHSEPIYCMSISSDCKYIATGSYDHTAKIWSAESGECLLTLIGHYATINSILMHSDKSIVYTAAADNRVKKWDAKTGECLGTFYGHDLLPASLEQCVNAECVIAKRGNFVTLWNLKTKKLYEGRAIQSSRENWQHASILMSPIDEASTAILRDSNTGESIGTFQGHYPCITAGAVSANYNFIVTGSSIGQVRVWDKQTGTCLHNLYGHEDDIVTIGISADGSFIVTGSADGSSKIWNPATGRCIRTLEGIFFGISADNSCIFTIVNRIPITWKLVDAIVPNETAVEEIPHEIPQLLSCSIL